MRIICKGILAKGKALVRGILSGQVQTKGEVDGKDFATPMRSQNKISSAFTMVELVFVVVVLGILASVGANLMPDNRLLNDVNMLTMKIKERQKNAIGNSVYRFGEDFFSQAASHNCIDLTPSGIESIDQDSQKPYRFRSTMSVSESNTTLCFDEYGRPFQTAQLLLDKIDINVTLEDQNRIISVMPMTGYVIIK